MFDLDIIMEKKRYIKFLGRDVEIKPLTMKEYLKAEATASMIEQPEGVDDSVDSIIEYVESKMVEYIMIVLDVTKKEAKSIKKQQFMALREYLSELDLLDQGYTEQEIKKMKAKVAKNRMEQAINSASEK